MKKIIVFVSLIAISCLAASLPAFAQEDVQATDNQVEITTESLGVENAGILPSSPFYFLKEWRRRVTKVFTFDEVKKAELELQYTNERAAEIKKMEEVAPSRVEAITRAAANYEKNAERLRERMEVLKETSENPNIDEFLNKLVDRSLQHQELFDELKLKFEDQEQLRERLEAGQERIDEVITKVPEKFEDIDAFKERLEMRLENKVEGIDELQAVEIIDRVRQKLPLQDRERIQNLQENLLEKFEDKIETMKLEEKDLLPAQNLLQTRVLKETEENLSPEIKQRLENLKESIRIQLQQRQETGEGTQTQTQTQTRFCSDLTLEEAQKIALNSECARQGTVSREASCNTVTNTWWFDLKVTEPKEGCSPACVVNAKTRQAEINWRCTGLKPSPATDICIQVITPAVSSDGVCKEFPTPCDVPSDWKKVDACQNNATNLSQ